MLGIWIRTVIGTVLLTSAAWAGNSAVDTGLLTADIDDYLHQRQAVVTDAVVDDETALHAMFWGEAPDWLIVQGGIWLARLTGPITVDGNQVLDLSSTLGLDDTRLAPFARLGLRLWRFELILEAWWFGTDGRAIVDDAFEIGGIEFEVNDVIDSRFTLNSYRAALGFEVWQGDKVTVTLLAGLTAIYSTGRIETVSLSKVAKWAEWLPVPAIGISLAGELLGNFIYEFEGNWIGFSDEVFSIASVDLRLAIGYQFNDWVLVRVGFRYMTVDGDIEDISVDLELSGVYFEGAITF